MGELAEALMDAYYEEIAAELALQTDVLYPNDHETLHPDYYTVQAEDLPALVKTVIALLRG